MMEETAPPMYFGEWLKNRRKQLDLTQAELARRASCSLPGLRKIEAGERRPSKQLAELLATALEIPSADQKNFIRIARGELNVERIGSIPQPASGDHPLTRSQNSSHGNLPGILTPFIGREPEIAVLSRLLQDPQCKLLSIVAAGGIGKTRLAIEVASRHIDQFPDGVWFIPLASVNSPLFLVSAIADGLNFSFHDPAKPRQQLINYLHDKRLLLVLDNVEHLIDGVELFSEILAGAPQVKLLTTSRERLNLLYEWVFEIQGLPVPPDGQVEQFEEYSSIALFLQTARRIQAGFELSQGDRQWVFSICRIMEGMPLGIELSAAWVGLLSCEEIAREIERNFDFLTLTMRDLPERHRSLRATLDHSWNLLNLDEKNTLSRLSVFEGSFDRHAAVEVCGASLPVLSSLKDKSLLRRTEKGRYSLHEMIHQYTALRLSEDAAEEARIKDRHAIYFAQRLSEWEKDLQSSRQVETLTEMAQEIDNLRQAWQRMVSYCNFDTDKTALFNPGLFHSSLFSLSLFYELRCRNVEAVSLLGQSLECLKAGRGIFTDPQDKIQFDIVLGHLTAYLGLHNAYLLKYEQSLELLEEAISLLQAEQARLIRAQAQVMLGWVIQYQFRMSQAIDLYTDSLAIFTEEKNVWWKNLAISLLAGAYLTIGKLEDSISLYQEALELVAPGDLRLKVPILIGMGRVTYLRGDIQGAERLLQECLDLSLKLENTRQISLNYLCLGQVAMSLGQFTKAENYFRDSVRLLDRFGESADQGVSLLYLGKSLGAQHKNDDARKTFLKVSQIGQAVDLPALISIGLLNNARLLLAEGQDELALEIVLIVQRSPLVVKTWQNEFDQMWQDINTRFTKAQIEAAGQQIEDLTLASMLNRLSNVYLS